MEESLSDFEKNLCKTIQRTEIAGKRGRTVAVLFPSIVKLGIDKLIETRSKVSSMENEYLFPVLSSTSHLRGTDCLRKLSELCGAKEPERLRSTKLRKQIATLSQIMNLQDNELDILAQFLGHDIRVHREYYRLPEATVQVAKVSKLLLAMEKGNMQTLKGKSLFEIDISTDDPIQDSSDDEQAETMEEENEEGKDVEEEEDQFRTEKEDEIGTDDEIGTETALLNQKTADGKKRKASPRIVKKRKRICVKQQWTTEEKEAVSRHLDKFIVRKKIPGKADIEKCKAEEPSLSNRSWRNIKDHCRNRIIAL